MPKFSLKRRHRREHDLRLLQRCPPAESLCRETALRKVSDDDIQITGEPSAESSQPQSDIKAPTSPQKRLRKRTSRLALVDASFTSCLGVPHHAQRSDETQTEHQDELSQSPSSPWGQFVDMVVPASSSDLDESPRSTVCDLTTGFLPFCPTPAGGATLHPYHHPKRQRLYAHRRNDDTSLELKDFFLRVPDDVVPPKQSSSSDQSLAETQDALNGLTF